LCTDDKPRPLKLKAEVQAKILAMDKYKKKLKGLSLKG
jgi:hypothetical protein